MYLFFRYSSSPMLVRGRSRVVTPFGLLLLLLLLSLSSSAAHSSPFPPPQPSGTIRLSPTINSTSTPTLLHQGVASSPSSPLSLPSLRNRLKRWGRSVLGVLRLRSSPLPASPTPSSSPSLLPSFSPRLFRPSAPRPLHSPALFRSLSRPSSSSSSSASGQSLGALLPALATKLNILTNLYKVKSVVFPKALFRRLFKSLGITSVSSALEKAPIIPLLYAYIFSSFVREGRKVWAVIKASERNRQSVEDRLVAALLNLPLSAVEPRTPPPSPRYAVSKLLAAAKRVGLKSSSSPPSRSAPALTHAAAIAEIRQLVRSLDTREYEILKRSLYIPSPAASDSNSADSESSSLTLTRVAGDGPEDDGEQVKGLDDVQSELRHVLHRLISPSSSSSPPSSLSSSSISGDKAKGLRRPPPGVLLYGPPGCGKTLLAGWSASVFSRRGAAAQPHGPSPSPPPLVRAFLVVTPNILHSKFFGETSKNVQALFGVASKLSPSVIFVDECDAVFRDRGAEPMQDGGDVQREMKSTFMQLWDGANFGNGGKGAGPNATRGGDRVLVLAATNRPFDVDPAFLRRMPKSFMIGFPNLKGRVDILKSMLRHVPVEKGFGFLEIAKKTEGYSGSDLKELCRCAVDISDAASRLSPRPKASSAAASRPLTTADARLALQKSRSTYLAAAAYRESLAKYETGVEAAMQEKHGGAAGQQQQQQTNHQQQQYYPGAAHSGEQRAAALFAQGGDGRDSASNTIYEDDERGDAEEEEEIDPDEDDFYDSTASDGEDEHLVDDDDKDAVL